MTNQNQPSEVKEGGALEAAAFLELCCSTSEKYGLPTTVIHTDKLRTILDALAAGPPSMERGEAEGWRLVPVEPTEEMLFKGWKATGTVIIPAIRVAYAAMLAAAPSPAPSAVEMAGVEEMAERLWVKPCGDHGSYSRGHDNGWNSALRAILALATASREKGSSAARELPPAVDMSCEEMLEALRAADEALAQVTAFEDDARQIMGNTNFNIVQMRREQVKAAIAKAAPSPASMPQTGGEA